MCGRAVASSQTDSNHRAQLNQTGYNYNTTQGCLSSGPQAQPSGHLGTNAALKRTTGAVCSSVATTYSTATTAYKASMAYWSSSACGNGQTLQGGGISYFYNGSGYISRTVFAPFQVYP